MIKRNVFEVHFGIVTVLWLSYPEVINCNFIFSQGFGVERKIRQAGVID